MIDLSKKIFCIFGMNNCGKSYLAEKIASASNTVFFDPLGEHSKNFPAYVPKNKDYPKVAFEMESVIGKLQHSKYNQLIVDEASRIFPGGGRNLYPKFRSYFDIFRHTPLNSLGFIARKPQQMNNDLSDLASYLFIFKLTGKASISYLNDIIKGLGDVVATLEPYHFVMVSPDRNFQICNPI